MKRRSFLSALAGLFVAAPAAAVAVVSKPAEPGIDVQEWQWREIALPERIIIDDPLVVRWSDAADHADWTPSRSFGLAPLKSEGASTSFDIRGA